ncbi:DUF6221 family protein [Streptomyces jumonjinensis]|uniref:Uncharacterized protein n=1 Tax=Streptomyces jumonjinensis TaxID=1945 RepID=A0A646KQ66_STRJU|nr:DUF6221 family protein [Streptomyces jumonjinensis]MQT03146.1 hypothetical protein [Streptomyces jumonjinensis]
MSSHYATVTVSMLSVGEVRDALRAAGLRVDAHPGLPTVPDVEVWTVDGTVVVKVGVAPGERAGAAAIPGRIREALTAHGLTVESEEALKAGEAVPVSRAQVAEEAPVHDLVDFLTARYDEDELWAVEASRDGGEGPAQPGGVHWQWVEPGTDTPVEPDPARGPMLTDAEENNRFCLRSVEEFPTNIGTLLPQFAIDTDEVPAAAAGHIARHDPARVLREIDAKRRVLTEYAEVIHNEGASYEWAGGWANGLGRAAALLALPYTDHPDYREAWRL